jgi:CDP-glucose 4,6-dehydratase
VVSSQLASSALQIRGIGRVEPQVSGPTLVGRESDGALMASASAWSDRRVLVTGATGLVGSWLCRRLVQDDAFVVTYICDMDPQSELLRSGVVARTNVVNGRLEEADTVERAINLHEVDTVFHLGAQTIVGTAYRSPRQTFEANIAGTWNVLDACRRHPDLVKRVVVASSDKAYGTSAILPYTEDMPLQGRAPYEVSKSCTDLIAQSYARTYGVPVTIARCGNIYGGGDLNWSRIVPGSVRSLIQGRQPYIRSDGKPVRDYIHVDAVVDAYLLLADNSDQAAMAGEAFNFSDESPLTVLEIYRAVCDEFDGWVEPFIADEAGGEIPDQRLGASKARNLLGWRPALSLADGMRNTVEWYRRYFS